MSDMDIALQSIREVYDYHTMNQPPSFQNDCEDYVDELSESLSDSFEKIIRDGKYKLYEIYNEWSEALVGVLNGMKNAFNGKLDPKVICSRSRMIKQCSKIIREHYDNMLSMYDEECISKRKLLSSPSGAYIIGYIVAYTDRCLEKFDNDIKQSLCLRYRSSINPHGFQFGIWDGIVDINDDSDHDICVSMRYIIPNTDITVFEFLFMDFDPTHLPILNHEELMVKKFKTLKHLIEERCVILKNITNQNGKDSQDTEDVD